MSAVGTITKITGNVIGRTTRTVTHPIQSVSVVAGRARAVAASVIAGSHPGGRERPAATAVPSIDVAPAPDIPLRQPQEPSATEPKAASRNAAHGGPGDDGVDDWHEELTDGPDVKTPVGTTGAGSGINPDTGEADLQQPGTEPLMDPSLTKSVKSEADTMRRAADRSPKE